MFSPRWVVFKSCRTRPLCGAAHVKVFKLARKGPLSLPSLPGFRDFFQSLRFFPFFHSHYCRCKATPTQCSPTLSPAFSQPHIGTGVRTHPTQSSPHNSTNANAHANGPPPPPSETPPKTLPSLLPTVYIKAVSNCTLSLIGSAVQCAAVDSDKSFFQSPRECLPTAMSEDTGGGKKVNCPLAAIQMM